MPEERALSLPETHATRGRNPSTSSSLTDFEFEEDGPETFELELNPLAQGFLIEFRAKVEDAILANTIYGSSGSRNKKNENLEEIKLWGVPLLPSKGHEGTDVVLLKFLKAKDFCVSDAFSMLSKVMRWRRDFKVDQILDEKLGPEFESMWRMSGADKEGRPICYLSFRDLQNRHFKKKLFVEDGKLEEFLRWRILCLERAIQKLDFSPGGTATFLQITDLKNAPRQSMKELRWLCKKLLNLVRDYYPGLIYKNLIVNVPLWVFAVNAINLRQITARSKNMLIFVRSGKVTKALLKYINPEQLLAMYGGLRKENDNEFSDLEKVLEVNVRGNTVEHINIPATEVERTVTWDVAIVGNEVTYKAEFIPIDDCSYSVLLEKEKRMGKGERNSFYIREPGHIVLTIRNGTFKRRQVFYRYTSKPCVPVYMITTK